VPGAERRRAPLVLSPSGGCWTKASLDVFFKALVRTVATEERACAPVVDALVSSVVGMFAPGGAGDAGADHALASLVVRRGAAAVCAHGRSAAGEPAGRCGGVSSGHAVRAHTLYAAASAYAGAPPEAASPAQQAAAAVEQAQTLLQAAQDVTGPLPRACDLPAPIDDDDAIRRVHVDIDSLHAAARRADQTLALQPVDSGTESDSPPQKGCSPLRAGCRGA